MSNEMVIRNINVDTASAMVSDYGAHVLTWAPRGESAVVWCPSVVHLNEGKAIRGGVPIIFPWFNFGFENGRVTSKKPKHGFGRVSFWEFDERASNEGHLRYMLSDEAIDDTVLAQFGFGGIPRFHAIYDIEIGESLTMALTVCNVGNVPFAYEAALHTYLHVGDVDCAKVLGLEGARYVDTTLEDDPIVVQGMRRSPSPVWLIASTIRRTPFVCVMMRWAAPSSSPNKVRRRPWCGIRVNATAMRWVI